MGTDAEIFDSLWKKAVTVLNGKLIRKSNQQNITYPVVKMFLADFIMSWSDCTSEQGRWLEELSLREPEKGSAVRNILNDKMSLVEVPIPKNYGSVASLAVPVAGAAAGYRISSLLGAHALIKAASTILPAAALYPAVKYITDTVHESQKDDVINGYLSQLELYRAEIENVLSI